MAFLKNVFKLLLVVGLVVYFGYVFVVVGSHHDREVCTEVRIVIADSLHAGFVSNESIQRTLETKHMYPKGLLMDSVHSQDIELLLTKDPFIEEAVCYKTPGGLVHIMVKQRIPILRVMADNGQDYYLDERGYKMKPMNYDADLVVVTGHVDDNFALKYLVPIGCYIRHDDFWDNQVEQIYVTPQGELQMFTRVGDQTIYLGGPQRIEHKLDNLRLFYGKVLSQVGWNRYKEISVAYDNQVVCKK